MTTIRQAVLNKYKSLKKPNERTKSGKRKKSLHWYFSSFNRFAVALEGNRHAFSMLVFYLCMRIERAERMTLYYEMVKRHKIKKELAKEALAKTIFIKLDFCYAYEILASDNLTRRVISDETNALINSTRKIRNAIVHGDDSIRGDNAQITNTQKANTIITLLDYAIELNKEVLELSKFDPFSDLTGVFGAIRTVESTSEGKLIDLLKELKKKQKQVDRARSAEEQRQRQRENQNQ